MKFLQISLCCLLLIAQIIGLHGTFGKYQGQETGLNHLRQLITARKEDLASNVDNVVGKAAGSSDVISDDANLLNEYIDKISEAKKRTVSADCYNVEAYVGKQPKAWGEEDYVKYCRRKLKERMDRCTGRRDIT